MPRPLLAFALAAATLVATRPGDPADRLARALGDPDFAARERASDALRKMGPPALPAVRRAAASPDPEVRHRAAALLPTLETQAALAPARVVLPPAATPDNVLATIVRQTGYKLSADPPLGDTRFGPGTGPMTFWQAVDGVAERSGRAVTVNETGDGIDLSGDRARSPFVSLDGAFRVQLNDLHESRDIDFEAPGAGREVGKRDHRLTLNLTVLAEPRFSICAAGPAQVTAVDDRGGRLAVAAGPDDDPGREPPSFELPVALGLRRSSRSGAEIRTLTGAVPVRVVVDRRPVVVPNYLAAAGAEVRVGGAAVTLLEAGTDDDGDLRVRFRVRGPERLPAHFWAHRVVVTDLWGDRLEPTSPKISTGAGAYEVDVWFEAPGGWLNTFHPRVAFEEWVVVERRVAFTFRGVPLP